MRARNPLITAAVLSLAMTGPTLAAAWDGGSDGIHEQDQSKKKPNRGHGNNGGNQGEDLTRMRFYGLDTNHDGRITRDEWRGNQNSFNQHDWNGDGVLSGIEVTPGAQRPGTGNPFDRLDINRDGRISLSEWTGDRTTFDRLDLNDDGFLTRQELQGGQGGNGGNGGNGGDSFDRLDTNRDGRISLSEWTGDPATFDRLDRNDDGFLTRQELRDSHGRGSHFDLLDRNDDSRLSLSEWPGNRNSFDRLDRNRDGFLSPEEFAALDDDNEDD